MGFSIDLRQWRFACSFKGQSDTTHFLSSHAQVGVTETQYFLMSQTLGAAILGPQVQFLVVRVLELGTRVFENF